MKNKYTFKIKNTEWNQIGDPVWGRCKVSVLAVNRSEAEKYVKEKAHDILSIGRINRVEVKLVCVDLRE